MKLVNCKCGNKPRFRRHKQPYPGNRKIVFYKLVCKSCGHIEGVKYIEPKEKEHVFQRYIVPSLNLMAKNWNKYNKKP
jgi:hypothetical protein